MIGDVIKPAVAWIFTVVGITIVIVGFIKSKPHKIDPKNLILTLFLLIMSISFTIDFIQA
ncbi:MAG: hypothetical protein LBJ63_09230 [Prevotellaceae bacterium]|jgi:hypothetical protein|nr:hypothetical protein [Prevotellaceae bacterium]